MSRFNEYMEASWDKRMRKYHAAGKIASVPENSTHTDSIKQSINRIQKEIDDTKKQLQNNPKYKSYNNPDDKFSDFKHLDKLQEELNDLRKFNIPNSKSVGDPRRKKAINALHSKLRDLWSRITYVLTQYEDD